MYVYAMQTGQEELANLRKLFDIKSSFSQDSRRSRKISYLLRFFSLINDYGLRTTKADKEK